MLPKDADITPTADGFIVRASIEAPSDQEAFRTLSVPVCDAGPEVDINALVRDPEGHVSEFMDGRTAHGPSFDYFLLRDQVREQALADARQALGATVPYLTCDEAEELLAGLAGKQLAQPVTENNYSIHDLLRDFAHDVFAHDDQISEEDLWTRYFFCTDFLDETADTMYAMATASPSQSLESPVEEAKRQQRIAATADHLGVSDWITPLPWPPGWPSALPPASDPATSDPGSPAQGDM